MTAFETDKTPMEHTETETFMVQLVPKLARPFQDIDLNPLISELLSLLSELLSLVNQASIDFNYPLSLCSGPLGFPFSTNLDTYATQVGELLAAIPLDLFTPAYMPPVFGNENGPIVWNETDNTTTEIDLSPTPPKKLWAIQTVAWLRERDKPRRGREKGWKELPRRHRRRR